MVNLAKKKLWFGAFLLALANVVNCMDRSTLSGSIKDIQAYFDIRDGKGGALQSVLAGALALTTPMFGYIGDRFNRKVMVVVGTFLTMGLIAAGSVMPTFPTFFACRAALGIAVGCMQSVAPVILSDMFKSSSRSLAIALFYMALPVGYGLGFISGQGIATLTGHWRFAFLATGAIGTLITICMAFFLEDPPRGSSDGQDNLESSSYLEDLKSFVTNKSLILVVLSDCCVAYYTVGYSAWGAKYLQTSVGIMETSPLTVDEVAPLFGLTILIGGLVGVPIGGCLSAALKKRFQRADPFICLVGLTVGPSLIACAHFTIGTDTLAAIVMICIGNVFVSLHWSVSMDMVMYVVTPRRRASAKALGASLSYTLGDVLAPYAIGLTTDHLRDTAFTEDLYCSAMNGFNDTIPIGEVNMTKCEATRQYLSMRYSMISCLVLAVIPSMFYLICIFTLLEDVRKASSLPQRQEQEAELAKDITQK